MTAATKTPFSIDTDKRWISKTLSCGGGIDLPLLEIALRCIPGDHLKVWVEQLLENLADNRCGLPDLIRFSIEEASYRMIEVKGPGDRLQDNQKRWLEVFARHGHPAAVCHVRWDDSANAA